MDQALGSPSKQGNQEFQFEFSTMFQPEVDTTNHYETQQNQQQQKITPNQNQNTNNNNNQNQQYYSNIGNNGSNFSLHDQQQFSQRQDQQPQQQNQQQYSHNNSQLIQEPLQKRRNSNNNSTELKKKSQDNILIDNQPNSNGKSYQNKIEEEEPTEKRLMKKSSQYRSYENLAAQNNTNKKWPSVKQESNNSLCGSQMQNLQTIKGNVKNAYIKKINSLLNVQELGEESSEDKEKIKRVMSHDLLKIEQQNQMNNQQQLENWQQPVSQNNLQAIQEIKDKKEEEIEQESQNQIQKEDLAYMNYELTSQQAQQQQQQQLINNSNLNDSSENRNNEDSNNAPNLNKKSSSTNNQQLVSKPLMGDDKVKESAKNSRLRKKLYIELLEKKVTTLSQQIDQSYDDIKVNRTNIGQILKQNPYLQAFVTKRHENFQAIGNCVQQEKYEERQLSLILDSFNYRLGALGKTRTTALDTFFSSMLASFLQWNISLFLLGNQQYIQPSEDQEFQQCVEVFMKSINTTQRNGTILQIFKKIFNHRRSFIKAVRKVRQIKKRIEGSTQRIEKLFQQLGFDQKPFTQAKFVLCIEKYRKNEELIKYREEQESPQSQPQQAQQPLPYKRKLEDMDKFDDDYGMFPNPIQSMGNNNSNSQSMGRKKKKTGQNATNMHNQQPSNGNNIQNFNGNSTNNSQPQQQSQQNQQYSQYNQNFSQMQQQQQPNQQYMSNPHAPPPPPHGPPHPQQQNYGPPQPPMQQQYQQPYNYNMQQYNKNFQQQYTPYGMNTGYQNQQGQPPHPPPQGQYPQNYGMMDPNQQQQFSQQQQQQQQNYQGNNFSQYQQDNAQFSTNPNTNQGQSSNPNLPFMNDQGYYPYQQQQQQNNYSQQQPQQQQQGTQNRTQQRNTENNAFLPQDQLDNEYNNNTQNNNIPFSGDSDIENDNLDKNLKI